MQRLTYATDYGCTVGGRPFEPGTEFTVETPDGFPAALAVNAIAHGLARPKAPAEPPVKAGDPAAAAAAAQTAAPGGEAK